MSTRTTREIPNLELHALAVIAVLVWCVAFWLIWFVWLSWDIWRIPMGLGGALYPLFFGIPVLVGTVLGQLAMHLLLRRYPPTPMQAFAWLFALPALIATIALIVFAPMDVEMSYLEYFGMHVL
jgi:hypothetical protein